MLVLSNNAPQEHKQIEGSLSHDDITDMFSTIDMSCDSIINNEKNEMEAISSQENCEQTENIIINILEPPNSDSNDIEKKNLILENESMMPPVENIMMEKEVDMMEKEVDSDEISVSVSESSLITNDEAGQPKKKRAYKPRKKKDSL
jgi:hypothetical protein